MAKVQNMAWRQEVYRKEMLQYFARTLPWLVVIGTVVTFGFMYILSRYVVGDELRTTVGNMNWKQAALVMDIILLIPPALMMKPRKPRQEDIEFERAMRRSVGMDDSVEKE